MRFVLVALLVLAGPLAAQTTALPYGNAVLDTKGNLQSPILGSLKPNGSDSATLIGSWIGTGYKYLKGRPFTATNMPFIGPIMPWFGRVFVHQRGNVHQWLELFPDSDGREPVPVPALNGIRYAGFMLGSGDHWTTPGFVDIEDAAGKVGVFDARTGRVLVPPRHEWAASLHDSVVTFHDRLDNLTVQTFWHVGRNERLFTQTIPPGQYSLTGFTNGRVSGFDLATGRWGYKDATGAWAIRPTYEGAEQFHESVAWVHLDAKTSALIDTTGATLATLPRMTCGEASNGGVAVAYLPNEEVRFYDRRGTLLKALKGAGRAFNCGSVAKHVNGVVLLKDRENKIIALDLEGRDAIPRAKLRELRVDWVDRTLPWLDGWLVVIR